MTMISKYIGRCASHGPALCAATLTLLSIAASPPAAAQVESEADDRAATIARIGELLNERYVFPDVAAECAESLLEEFESGAFNDASSPEEFAQALTESLQTISHDKHMRVRLRPRPQMQADSDRPSPAQARAERAERARRQNHGFEQVERLEGNVGYVDMRYFSGDIQARDTATAAMNFLANSDALIFDMRRNGGGNPELIRYISTYLFNEPTHLNSLYWRQGDRLQEFWTLESVPGPRMADVPVFVLTSSYTFSGAEEFSYNLKTQERATLIGETTGGGANPGGVVPINDDFGIFIPTGLAVNPITGTNWEGVGVTPDIEMPADDALAAALELAQVAADARRAEKAANSSEALSGLDLARGRATRMAASGDAEGAVKALVPALLAAHKAGLLLEPEINQFGYELLGEQQTALAIGVFEFNVRRYPDSANVYDSLAEAYMTDGQSEKAIEFYTKSLELDPQNANAEAMIEQLRDGPHESGSTADD